MKIAIVEDDINMRKSLEIALSDYSEFVIKSFKNAKDALKKLDGSFDLVVTDINMPGMDGIEFVRTLDRKYEIIIMTGNATLQRAIDSIQLGAKDFLVKPFEIETLVDAIKRSHMVQKVIKNAPHKELKNDNFFEVKSEALSNSLKIASKAALTDATVMLLGESGVGKEVFANYIHENSTRKRKPFIAINMAAIPENLIESELFGFEKGAFTDANEARKGQFELANSGTLFLDEIAEMPYELQAKLLRAIQEKEIRRLGANNSIKIDVRIISATNANLVNSVTEGNFREDLYYRLNTIPVSIPPLRERKDEILPIAFNTLKQKCEQYALEEKEFSNNAQEALLNYQWRGNIRELISVVERAAILSEGKTIEKEALFLESRTPKKSINQMERELIKEVLSENDYNIEKSAETLGFSKIFLERKIKLLKIEELK